MFIVQQHLNSFCLQTYPLQCVYFLAPYYLGDFLQFCKYVRTPKSFNWPHSYVQSWHESWYKCWIISSGNVWMFRPATEGWVTRDTCELIYLAAANMKQWQNKSSPILDKHHICIQHKMDHFQKYWNTVILPYFQFTHLLPLLYCWKKNPLKLLFLA